MKKITEWWSEYWYFVIVLIIEISTAGCIVNGGLKTWKILSWFVLWE
jgi:hypothetical protein